MSLNRRGALEIALLFREWIDYLNGRWDCWWNEDHKPITYEVAYGFGLSKCLKCGKRLKIVATRK